MTVHNLQTTEDFRKTIKDNKLVLVDFFATWSWPCKTLAPIIADHSNDDKYKDIVFTKIDIDQLPDLSQELGIRSTPTLILYKDGETKEVMVGANPDPQVLETFLDKAL